MYEIHVNLAEDLWLPVINPDGSDWRFNTEAEAQKALDHSHGDLPASMFKVVFSPLH